MKIDNPLPFKTQDILSGLHDATIIMDSSGDIIYWNQQATELFGFSENDVIGQPLHDIITDKDSKKKFLKAQPHWQKSGEGKLIGQRVRTTALHQSGKSLTIELSLSSLHHNHQWFALATLRNLSEVPLALNEKMSDHSLQRVIDKIFYIGFSMAPFSDRLQHILEYILTLPWLPIDNSRGAIFLVSRANGEEWLELEAQVGLSDYVLQNCTRLPFGQCLCGMSAQNKSVIFKAHLDEQHTIYNDKMDNHGHYCIPIIGHHSKVIGVINSYIEPEHQQQESEVKLLTTIAETVATIIERETLFQHTKCLESLIEQSPVSIAITNNNGVFTYVNQAFCEISGYSEAELIGATPSLIKSGLTPPEVYQQLWESISSGKEWRGEIQNRRKNGQLYWESELIAPILNDNGEIEGYSAIKEDITQHKEHKQQLSYLETHDALTGIPNQKVLLDHLNQTLLFNARHKNTGALIFLDIINLTAINEQHGHLVGDQLVCAVAKRLKKYKRDYDTVARHTGNTFGIILAEVSRSEEITQFIKQRFESIFSDIFNISGFPIKGEYIAGFSIYGNALELSSAEVMQQAEIARHYAKVPMNTGAVIQYQPHMNADILREHQLKDELNKAITEQQFRLYYQPKVSLRTGHIVGAEALIRWQHPEKGLISPYHFIDYAEEHGLINEIGTWVIHETATTIKMWENSGLDVVPISVNVSAKQFESGNLEQIFYQALTDHQISGAAMELELTESAMLQNPEKILAILQAIAELGILTSLDDYGTGYSNLGYLKTFPITKLKIDRSFISKVVQSPHDAVIVRSTISMCHNLDIEVIAEGIELPSQLNFLIENQCDEIQGYLFSPPVAEEEFKTMMAEKRNLPLPNNSVHSKLGILFIDDEENVLHAIKRLLHHESYRVFITTNPEKALSLIAEHNIGVVVSDYKMPNINGLEFLSQVAEIFPNTVRMILSGYADSEVVISAINQGSVFRILTKPWGEKLLKENIDAAFNQHLLEKKKVSLEQHLYKISQETHLKLDETYLTGIEQVDKDHHELIETYNQLIDCYYLYHDDFAKITSIFERLVTDSTNHFSLEEKMMQQLDDENFFQQHQAEHQRLSQSLNEIVVSWQAHPHSTNLVEIVTFIKHWLLEHITEYDLRLAEHWKKRDVS